MSVLQSSDDVREGNQNKKKTIFLEGDNSNIKGDSKKRDEYN